jgi:Tol biopolymer transport system component
VADAGSTVFVDGLGPASELYVLSSNGTRRRLTRNRVRESFPAWSPDRGRIAFVRDGAIWVMKSDGTAARRLTFSDTSTADLYPAWSPDGKLIAFASNRAGGEAELFLMGADGRGVRRLTHTPRWVEDTQPSFSPSGRYIVFTANRPAFFNHEMYRIRTRHGRGLERLTVWGSGKDGAPGDDLGPSATWSREGVG